MDSEEKKAKDYLEEQEFICKRFTKSEMQAGKTPDFRIFKNGGFLFYCEVKSIQTDHWIDKQLEKEPPCKIVGGTTSDPIFNRLTADICKAVKQFDAVNPYQEVPNVLIFVNHDNVCDFNNLLGLSA